MKMSTRILTIVMLLVAMCSFDNAALAQDDCLSLRATDLVVGETAEFEIANATPGSVIVMVWGLREGRSVIENDRLSLCANFGIKNVRNKFRLAGLALADDDGHGVIVRRVPDFVGTVVLLQAAEAGTCPDSCVSNIVEREITEDR